MSERLDRFVSLPGVEISCASARAPRSMLVIGGRAPEPSWLAAAARCVREVVAVDSGVGACRAAGVRPSLWIGDADSSSADDRAWAAECGARAVSYDAAKDRTDFQLATAGRGGEPMLITGCFGGRADHLLSAIECAAACDALPVCMADNAEGIFFLDAERGVRDVEMRFLERVKAVSLLPISSECEGVRAAGVRWPLDGARLERRDMWAISNEPAECGGPVRISCEVGTLGVYWCADERLVR